MNTNNIKKYAPKARVDFQQAIATRASKLGIYPDRIEDAFVTGDIMQIGDKTFPSSQKSQRDAIVRQIEQQGFDAVIDHTASTWFNRLCAIRFMELKEYLDHGYRVLSHPTQANGFEILDRAADVADDLGLNRADVLEMSLAGNKEEELYRQLLLGQCHALHDAMDFLFDKVDDVSALLLPDGLTRTDSILRPLVDDVPEEDWEQVEVIGWLYQFYISEKKDEVIGKVVKSEDIPAATQLFTPNWIVQYLVQNSVGRQWMQTYPESGIKSEMPYYIEPAQQSDEVNAQLAAITPDSLEPESIKVLDPACGSGHILVEAYNTLKAIYNERGYKSRDIPKLILENNLFGLDIDDRAAQLAGFALMMIAREDDRRIFTRGVRLNVLSLQESAHLDISKLWRDLDLNSDQQIGLSQDLFAEQEVNFNDDNFKLIQLSKQWFLQAKTLGSLIDIPAEYEVDLKQLLDRVQELKESGNTAQQPAAEGLLPFIYQAWLLAQRYDSVVANPPYMGGKGMNKDLKDFAKKQYPNSKSDLFAMFIERGFNWLNFAGFNAMVTMQSWMFLSSFEKMRESLLEDATIENMVHMGNGVMKIAFGTNATVFRKLPLQDYCGFYSYCTNDDINESGEPKEFPVKNDRLNTATSNDFAKVPGSPIAYWVSAKILDSFNAGKPFSDFSEAKRGIATGDNEKFIRLWHEVSFSSIGLKLSREQALKSSYKWFPHNKGGESRKWYGNNSLVVNWKNNGFDVKNQPVKQSGDRGWRNTNEEFSFKNGITWGGLTNSDLSFRWSDYGALFDTNKGPMMFPSSKEMLILGFLNSNLAIEYCRLLNPTVSFQNADINRIPFLENNFFNVEKDIERSVENIVNISKWDWSQNEDTWEFKKPYIILFENRTDLLYTAFENYLNHSKKLINEYKLEYTNIDHIFCDTLNVPTLEVTDSRVHLLCNPTYKYGVDKEENLNCKVQASFSSNLVSYFLGCMMGRYSLDREGLVYAHSGNEGFTELVNEGAYKSYPADDDGIIPLTDMEWFADDATYRFRDFVRTVWGEEHLQENLEFVAESLCLNAIKPKRGESSLEIIRRYMSTQFYKDHLKTYKNRPIYWLFSSGKQKAFECLVYLHRYHEGTLSRMRTEYVTPLLGKYEARLGQLEQQLDSASTSEKTKLQKEISALEQKQTELRTFDDKLKHHADMRISLDLDDGVKVNYGKFGDLLADVKSIHGKAVK